MLEARAAAGGGQRPSPALKLNMPGAIAALLRQRRLRRTACGRRRRRRRSWPGWSAPSCRWATGRRTPRRPGGRRRAGVRARPGASVALPKWRCSAGASTSCISVDLPEPADAGDTDQMLQRELDRHVLQVVLARARISRGVDGDIARLDAHAHVFAPAEVGAGERVGGADRLRRAVETICPRSPGPGPMSIRRSAASITAGSCSTTTSVLPASRRRCMAS